MSVGGKTTPTVLFKNNLTKAQLRKMMKADAHGHALSTHYPIDKDPLWTG